MISVFSVTDIGQKRQLNQDYIFSSSEPLGNLSNLFVVADGMGGHAAGDYASKTAVETIVSEVEDSFEKNPMVILKKAIEKANGVIYAKSMEEEALHGMGTTVVAATFVGKYLEVVNVGDSRLYRISGGKIEQITVDHSLVEEMVRKGGIPRTVARTHPDKNIITRAVGVRPAVEADTFTSEILCGDRVLLCSDGLSNMLEDEEILRIVTEAGNEKEAAKMLVKAANEAGGKDNISAIVIEKQ